MNNVCNGRLRSALNFHRSTVEFDAKIFRGAELARDFLHPVAAFPVNPALLAESQRCQRKDGGEQASEFDCVFQ